MGLFASMAVNAAEKAVVVISNDGSQHVVTLADVDRIEIGPGALTISHRSAESVTKDYADIDRVLIGATPTAIGQITSKGDIAVWPTEVVDVINVAGLHHGMKVEVFDLAGHLVAAKTADGDSLTIDLSASAPGMLVVSIGGKQSVKVVKK